MPKLHDGMYLLLQSRGASMLSVPKPLRNRATTKSEALFQPQARLFLVDFPSETLPPSKPR